MCGSVDSVFCVGEFQCSACNSDLIVPDCCTCNQPFWCSEDASADRARREGVIFR